MDFLWGVRTQESTLKKTFEGKLVTVPAGEMKTASQAGSFQ
jgi:hypothetical protein